MASLILVVKIFFSPCDYFRLRSDPNVTFFKGSIKEKSKLGEILVHGIEWEVDEDTERSYYLMSDGSKKYIDRKSEE